MPLVRTAAHAGRGRHDAEPDVGARHRVPGGPDHPRRPRRRREGHARRWPRSSANGLAERGLVDRHPCEDDRRVVRLELTPEGRTLLDRARRRRNAWLAERFAALTEDERVALAEAVTVIERLNRDGSRRREAHVPLAAAPQLPHLLHVAGRVVHRHVAAARRPDAARAAPDRQRHRPRAAHRHPVRPDAAPRRLGRRRHRPPRQAPAHDGHDAR